MIRFSFILFLLSLASLNAQVAQKKSIPIVLPNGKPAKHLKITVSKRSLIHNAPDLKTKTETFQTDGDGRIHLSEEWTQPIQFFVFDAPGFAIHIQAWVPLHKIQLVKDENIQGILVDKKDSPIKNTKICVSQSIGLIWGQIWIPKGINSTTTNDKGEFTLRKMVLNDVKNYSCFADIVRVSQQKKKPAYSPSMTLQFSGNGYKISKQAIRVTVTEPE